VAGPKRTSGDNAANGHLPDGAAETAAGKSGKAGTASAPSPTASPAPATSDQPAPSSPPESFPVVGIGASAGGLGAFEAFFSAMPSDSEPGIAFVLVQHLAPDHKSLLVELLQRYTNMQVFEAADGMKVRANCAYIIPPNADIALTDHTIRLTEPAMTRGLRLPIDHLFRSLAEAHRERAMCIVLSGTGSDGALGVRAIKGEGGMAMAQSPESAEHDGMPLAAIGTGLVDYVLPPAMMPEQLLSYVQHAYRRLPAHEMAGRDRDFLSNVCALLRARTGHDFSQYKETTLVRRLERRMALHQIDDGNEYLRHARDNPNEVDFLFRDLLIGVTNFFRDPEAFALLEAKVIPKLLAEHSPRTPVRVWVCGCSTGEEAYSIAILLQEQIEAAKRAHTVQLFATDIDRTAIERARLGIYPASIAADITPERLARNFTYDEHGDSYRINKSIRDMLIFSEQDVIKDPPFSRLDLVSCRNLLIYLSPAVQRRLIPLFHYALRPGGTLFLGPSETVGESAPLFQTIDRKWKIYLRPETDMPGIRPALPRYVSPRFEREAPARSGQSLDARGLSPQQLTEQVLLTHYAPVAMLVNARGEIVHIVGRSGRYLEPSPGDATMNVLSMARDGLRRELTVSLHKAVTAREPVVYRNLRVRSNGDFTLAHLTVRPALTTGDGSADLYLVILEELPPDEQGGAGDGRSQSSDRMGELEQELRAKEEYLQTTLEELETTNEELKSANEEMQSVNEELQSTNEELETSKEELQSVNEELSTVNTELQDKVNDLTRVNNDMNNLLAGTGVGTVFVDFQLRVSRFTPAATQVLNLIPTDVGRPVGHVTTNFTRYDRLVEDTREVLETLAPIEAEVQVESGEWYLMRIRPYRTTDNVIDGAVLTFVDISERRRAEESLRASEARFQAVVSQAYAAVTTLDPAGRFTYANDEACAMLGYPRDELLKLGIQDITAPEDLARILVPFEALATGGAEFESETRCRRRDGSTLWTHTRFNGIRNADGAVESVASISFDISERKRLEAELARTDAQLARDVEGFNRLHALNTMSAGASSLQPVLDEIVEAAVTISGADMGSLQILDDAGDMRIAAQRGLDPALAQSIDGAPGREGPAWRALTTRSRVVVDDIAHHVAEGGQSLAALEAAGVHGLQATPLLGRFEALVGVCTTYFRSPAIPPQRTLTLLDLLARQAAEIVERVRTERRGRKDP